MFNYGLKLWSINENYLPIAKSLYASGLYNYIELYAFPGSYEKLITAWKSLDIPFIVHAPHWRDGINLASKKDKEKNLFLIKEAQKYADSLCADKIIVHPGIAGDIKETMRQLREINDDRILIENKPYYALDNGLICNGTTPEEIKFVMLETGVGFCFDIGHGICSGNGHKVEPYGFIADFLTLNPAMYHLSDGGSSDFHDQHKHLGFGNYDFGRILSLLPPDAIITVETVKDSSANLDDFIRDINYLRKYEGN